MPKDFFSAKMLKRPYGSARTGTAKYLGVSVMETMAVLSSVRTLPYWVEKKNIGAATCLFTIMMRQR
jgi:hypothetical protein